MKEQFTGLAKEDVIEILRDMAKDSKGRKSQCEYLSGYHDGAAAAYEVAANLVEKLMEEK